MSSLRRVLFSVWALLVGAGLVTGGLLALLPVPWQALAVRGWHALTMSGVAGLITLGGAVLLLVVATPRVVTRVRNRNGAADRRVQVRPIPMWAIWLGLLMVLLVGGGAAWVLVSTFGSGSPQDKIRLEAIKLAGTIAVGTGGVAALLLTARRQRTTELDLVQKGHDADERRITELFTAAAQQLASDKAPVRLAGLYALSRLGQSSPDHRQTIVHLWCAYLRMPDASSTVEDSAAPASQPDSDTEQAQQDGAKHPLLLDLAPTLAEAAGLSLDGVEQQRQERQVRMTAQRLLILHLSPELDKRGQLANPDFWGGQDGAGLNLDLSNATLHDWNFKACRARRADFTDARFHGVTWFNFAHFHDLAWFNRAKFYDLVWFDGVQFHERALFDEVEFHKRTSFNGAKFHDRVRFYGVQFCDYASFNRSKFPGRAWFDGVQFHDHASFKGAQVHDAGLLKRVSVRLDRSSDVQSVWPPGYTVCEADSGYGRAGRWGKLVHEHDTAVTEETAARSTAADDDVNG